MQGSIALGLTPLSYTGADFGDVKDKALFEQMCFFHDNFVMSSPPDL